MVERDPRETVGSTRRVGLIGHGAIGRVVGAALASGTVPNASLAGVLTRSDGSAPKAVASLEELLESADLVVEAASQAAVVEYGARVKDAGVDLVVLSVGALVDDELRERLASPQGGRLLLSTGACGGLDVLRAAMLVGPLHEVTLCTTKSSAATIRPWMEDALRERLETSAEPVTAFRGPARQAVRLFPESANIAGLLALATIGFDAVEVEIRGEQRRTSAKHEITARGLAGSYAIRLENATSPDNPRTSAITGHAVVRALADADAWLVAGW